MLLFTGSKKGLGWKISKSPFRDRVVGPLPNGLSDGL